MSVYKISAVLMYFFKKEHQNWTIWSPLPGYRKAPPPSSCDVSSKRFIYRLSARSVHSWSSLADSEGYLLQQCLNGNLLTVSTVK